MRKISLFLFFSALIWMIFPVFYSLADPTQIHSVVEAPIMDGAGSSGGSSGGGNGNSNSGSGGIGGNGGTGGGNCTPPPSVTNTSTTSTQNSITLSWQTPSVSNLSEFDIRISENPINEFNFNTSRPIPNIPAPLAGRAQSATISNLQPSKTYYFGIKLLNICGQESGLVTLMGRTLQSGGELRNVPPVSNFKATALSRSVIVLTWKTPLAPNLSEFDIRISENPINEFNFNTSRPIPNIPAPLAGQNQSVDVTGLKPNTTYYFGIRLYNIVGMHSEIVTTSERTLGAGTGGGNCTPPPSVTNTSTTSTQNSITLSWQTPSVSNLSEFDIRISENPINEFNFNTSRPIPNIPAPLAGRAQSATISNLQPSKTYYFGIKLLNICGQESGLVTLMGRTLQSGGELRNVPPVSNFKATALSRSVIVLTWKTPLAPNLSEFDIRISENPINEFNFNTSRPIPNIPAPLAGQNQSVDVTGLKPNTTYYFGIRLYNIVGMHSEIVTTSERTLGAGTGGGNCTPPPSVTNTSTTSTQNSITLSWQTPSVSNLSEFDIRISENPINEFNFNTSRPIPNIPAPLAGRMQSATISNLQPSKTYYFGIKLLNICGQESGLVTLMGRTLGIISGGGSSPGGGTIVSGGVISGGGGSNAPLRPTNISILINDGALITTSTKVKLTIYAENATEMAISNSLDFREVNWEPYKTSKDWELTPQEGVKRVFAMFRNANKVPSQVVSDDILYVIPKFQEPQTSSPQLPLPVKRETRISSEVDFNTLMVRWGDFRNNDPSDLNKDGKVNEKDVFVLFENWVDINVKNKEIKDTNLAIDPANKFNVVKGDDVILILKVKPSGNYKNYTARIRIEYPKELLEYKSFTYDKNWIPVRLPKYDYLDETNEKGIIVKTAGYPKGFNEEKMFGILIFRVKSTGKGTISFSKDNAFVLDAQNGNTLSGVVLPGPLTLEAYDNTYNARNEKNIYFPASIFLAAAKRGNFIFFFLIFLLLIILYLVFILVGKLLKENEIVPKLNSFLKKFKDKLTGKLSMILLRLKS